DRLWRWQRWRQPAGAGTRLFHYRQRRLGRDGREYGRASGHERGERSHRDLQQPQPAELRDGGFAPGNANYATLRITDNAALPQTIANFTGTHDTVDLTALAYVGAQHERASRHGLQQAHRQQRDRLGGAAARGGRVHGYQLEVANDGSGGTDV